MSGGQKVLQKFGAKNFSAKKLLQKFGKIDINTRTGF